MFAIGFGPCGPHSVTLHGGSPAYLFGDGHLFWWHLTGDVVRPAALSRSSGGENHAPDLICAAVFAPGDSDSKTMQKSSPRVPLS